jgi:excinuclease ABC subunit C
VPELPDDVAEMQQWLTSVRRGHGGTGKVTLRVAQRGDLAALAETARRNAHSALASYKTRRSSDFTARSQALADIQEALGMPNAPLRIECFDVSHLGGTNIVASMVVFEDGLPRKDLYRRFSIPESTDDTDSIHQVLTRRLARLDDSPLEPIVIDGEADAANAPDAADVLVAPVAPRRFAYRPNLLIVDGGQPQVQAAARALREAGVDDIALCGIAKRLEEVWLPDSEYPVILPRNSDAMFLFQRIRDEAHRFAISYQRQKRKKDINSQLAEVPGLGPARVRELLRHFGSVTRLRAASVDELAQVKGIGPATARAIHEHLASSA